MVDADYGYKIWKACAVVIVAVAALWFGLSLFLSPAKGQPLRCTDRAGFINQLKTQYGETL